MSKNNIDRLFKNRLEHLAAEPSEQAWAKVNQNLSDGKSALPFKWKRLAAAILLLFTVAIIIKHLPATKELQLAESYTPPSNRNVKVEKELQVAQAVIAEADEPKAAASTLTVIEKKAEQTRPVKSDEEEHDRKAPQIKEKFIVDATHDHLPTSTKKAEIKSTTLVLDITSLKPIAGDKKVIEMTELETEKTQESTFEKIIRVAKNVKNGETGLGDLRVVKDQLLAKHINEEEDVTR